MDQVKARPIGMPAKPTAAPFDVVAVTGRLDFPPADQSRWHSVAINAAPATNKTVRRTEFTRWLARATNSLIYRPIQ
jgi:hypothetical protein